MKRYKNGIGGASRATKMKWKASDNRHLATLSCDELDIPT